MNTESIGIGHNQLPPEPLVWHESWPADAVARIYRPCRGVDTAGPARNKKWVLQFERRTPATLDPLMGWTESDDPLAQILLTFDSLQEAIRYAEREGLTYRVEGAAPKADVVRQAQARKLADIRRRQAAEALYTTAKALSWQDPRYGVAPVRQRPDLDRALTNPASAFRSPQEVIADASLTGADKCEILRCWPWDAWLIETASGKGMPPGEESRLDEVEQALLALDSGGQKLPGQDFNLFFRFDHSGAAHLRARMMTVTLQRAACSTERARDAESMAPACRAATRPFLKTNRAGTPWTLNSAASCGSASTSTFRNRALGPNSFATRSNAGAIARQGPHHEAQKSTTTGMSLRSM
ncbi:hypothetical protein MOX02_58810 [Methylobacterium oxalidis]|uniref:ETC complex I subunit n=1 Tax=Methylobacterium oxalidis TaxID=944322 RepID=A0A512JD04_9HYPH|nr:hypothetical protein MOX02_58810 [Methylobacterium oxalidis]GJE35797.1 hypothetical protein LDDCCGHA_6017 [Methylobacterium oxalidis]GLS64883.1 hypothetical protein GCM10007888_32640 [Methylobacterium oxalidis]